MRRFSVVFGLAGFAMAASLPVVAAPGGPGGARNQGPRPITGQVTAKGDTTIDVQGRGRGGAAGETVKVTIEQATKLYKLEPGTAEDLAADYLVVVVGTQAENKVTADGVVRLNKVAGTPGADELRVATGIGAAAGRLLQARRPDQG
ncbi:MAG: hypothetical protein QHJ73_19065, partial [Armatimonadota bacterium]|nr:hypothetical protein [Armatimonadota bacterium]